MTSDAETVQRHWNASAEQLLDACAVDPSQGLSTTEASRRLLLEGPNRLRAHRPRSDLAILVDQFRSLIVGLLVVAAAVAFVFGEIIEGIAVTVVIMLNTGIGFVTERHARRSMDALFALGTRSTRVRRNGSVVSVSAEMLVRGDIVVLEAGDVVTADLRLLEASLLESDESALTGESLPVSKSVQPVELEAPLAERRCMLFKGCAVTAGSGEALVIGTGMDTELGRISELVSAADADDTPLEKRLDRLGHRLVGVTIAIAALVTASGALAGRDLFLMVETGLALAIAAIPEGLPVVATLALARGMHRMAERRVLVRRLASVETLGSTSVICTDKTGTLTENRMSLTQLVLDSCEFVLDPSLHAFAAPSADEGTLDDETRTKLLTQALTIGALCNDAVLAESEEDDTSAPANTSIDDAHRMHGDPMELALLQGARNAGLHQSALLADFPRLRAHAFDPDRRLMATVHRSAKGLLCAVKGAPEAVLSCCTQVASGAQAQLDGVVDLSDEVRAAWLRSNESLAAEGLRVIALATRELAEPDDDPYESLVFVGLAAFSDPPRADVRSAIAQCHDAGVRVVMVTGDQGPTALGIARAIGIVEPEDTRVQQGTALDDLAGIDAALREELLVTRVFARVDPRNKLELIALHQDAGHIVAMTGDGVNDAPALEKADIGIAMGLRGTDVAKEAADMVLLDDAFASIVAAINQGRIIYENIRTFVLYLMSCNVGEVLIVAVAAIGGSTLPLLPLQILFLNLVTDVFPALALAVGPGSRGLMKQSPRDPKTAILDNTQWRRIVMYGCVFTVAVLGALAFAERVLGLPSTEAVTISFLTLAFAQLWHVFSMRAPASRLCRNEITRNPMIWCAIALCIVLILIAVYVPGFANVLGLVPPDAGGWLLVLTASVLPLLVGQLSLLWRRRRGQPERIPGKETCA